MDEEPKKWVTIVRHDGARIVTQTPGAGGLVFADQVAAEAAEMWLNAEHVEYMPPSRKEPLPYHEAVEVQECGANWANEYLEHGYTLFAVGPRAIMVDRPRGDDGVAREPWLKKGVSYVLGRPAAIPHFQPKYVPRSGGRQNEVPAE